MASYLHPGVYVEEVPSGSRPIEAAGTSTAAFIGYATKGPFKEPTLISSWEEYDTLFGGLREKKSNSNLPDDLMGRAAYAYFLNGGGRAYIVRVAQGAGEAKGSLETGSGKIEFTAANPGTWGDQLKVKVIANDSSVTTPSEALFKVQIGYEEDDDFDIVEEFEDISLGDDQDDLVSEVLSEESELVGVSELTGAQSIIDEINTHGSDGATIELEGGDDGSAAGQTLLSDDIFPKLLKYRDINTLLLPDYAWDDDNSGQAVIELAISHCETMKNRMVIFDLEQSTELNDENDVTSLNLSTSTYAATYYPWPKISNPFYDADRNRSAPRLLPVPASAYAAGQWAQTDRRRGVWKAPAGVESNLLGVNKLSFTVEDEEQKYLNPQGINAFRQLPNYGAVIWGTRTRSTRANPEWRYIPVRRTAIFIEESIFHGIHWAVFEPNDHRLWSALRLNIESFLSGLHRSGAFQGEKSSDAYFVRCGLGQTMTQGDIDRGQVIVQVGFAPLKPAEFVIVRIQQKVGQ